MQGLYNADMVCFGVLCVCMVLAWWLGRKLGQGE